MPHAPPGRGKLDVDVDELDARRRRTARARLRARASRPRDRTPRSRASTTTRRACRAAARPRRPTRPRPRTSAPGAAATSGSMFGRARDRVDVARRVAHRAAHRPGHRREPAVEVAGVADAAEAHLEPEQARCTRTGCGSTRRRRCRCRSASSPTATAAAEPPDEPPGVRSGFHGLRVVPCRYVRVQLVEPNSGEVVSPTSTAPAACRRAASVAVVVGDRVLVEQRRVRVGPALDRDELLHAHRHAGPRRRDPRRARRRRRSRRRARARLRRSRKQNAFSSGVELLDPLDEHVEQIGRPAARPARTASASSHASRSQTSVIDSPCSCRDLQQLRERVVDAAREHLEVGRTRRGRPTARSAACRRTTGCRRRP